MMNSDVYSTMNLLVYTLSVAYNLNLFEGQVLLFLCEWHYFRDGELTTNPTSKLSPLWRRCSFVFILRTFSVLWQYVVCHMDLLIHF